MKTRNNFISCNRPSA